MITILHKLIIDLTNIEHYMHTLPGTIRTPSKVLLQMIFLFPRWDMLVFGGYSTSILSMNIYILMSLLWHSIQHQSRNHHKLNDFGFVALWNFRLTPKYQSFKNHHCFPFYSLEVVLGDGNPKPKKPWKPSAQRRCHGNWKRMPRGQTMTNMNFRIIRQLRSRHRFAL